MNHILETNLHTGNFIELILLILAVFRVYLEVIRFDFAKLPITRKLSQGAGRSKEQLEKFHRTGFYFAVGFILVTAPSYLLN